MFQNATNRHYDARLVRVQIVSIFNCPRDPIHKAFAKYCFVMIQPIRQKFNHPMAYRENLPISIQFMANKLQPFFQEGQQFVQCALSLISKHIIVHKTNKKNFREVFFYAYVNKAQNQLRIPVTDSKSNCQTAAHLFQEEARTDSQGANKSPKIKLQNSANVGDAPTPPLIEDF